MRISIISPDSYNTMKKQILEDLQIVNPHCFNNPVCQGTFDSLPKIYGSIKAKIAKNKLRFYQQLPHRSNYKIKYLGTEPDSLQKSNSRRRKQKQQPEIEEVLLERSSSRRKTPNVVVRNQFSDKFHKLKKTKRQGLHLSRNKRSVPDKESGHKVKFNTLHFLPGIKGLHSRRQKPETLSQLIEDKIEKSVDHRSPLLHLYKSKHSPTRAKAKGQIKEEVGNDSGRYIPKSIERSLQIKKEMRNSLFTNESRFRTEPEKDYDFNSTNKSRGVMTEFSKRLLTESYNHQNHQMGTSSTKFHVPSKQEFKEFIENYKEMSPGFHLPKVLEAERFQIITYDNAVYFGEFDSVKQGEGILISEDFVFEGSFRNDQKHRGVQITYDGLYIGKFVNGLREGKGKFQWNNGQEYRGDWKEGKKHGQGIWKSPNGDYYQGEWVKGRQEGTGVHHHKTSTYRGQFKGSLKHGNGEETFANGDTYKGMYHKGRPQGKGRYDWNDGSYYEGQFNEGYREGRGEFREHNGSCYKGCFKRDFKHGFGQQIEKSGQKYSGLFQQGVRVYNSSPKQ